MSRVITLFLFLLTSVMATADDLDAYETCMNYDGNPGDSITVTE